MRSGSPLVRGVKRECSQSIARWFPPCFDVSQLDPAMPDLRNVPLVRLPGDDEDASLLWDAGLAWCSVNLKTSPVPSGGKGHPLGNTTIGHPYQLVPVLLLPCSPLLSRPFQPPFPPRLLRSLRAEGTCTSWRSTSVLSLHRRSPHSNQAMKGGRTTPWLSTT